MRTIWRYRLLYLMILPVLIYFFVFSYLPMFGIIMAFENFRPTRGFIRSDWVGLENFVTVFGDSDFWRVLRNTVLISIYKLLFSLPAPIILALLINEVRLSWYRRTVQTIIYLPHFISWAIVAGLLGAILSPEGGLLNDLLVQWGVIEEPIIFMGEPKLYRAMLVASDMWKNAGWGTIIFLAAMTSINPETYEAAVIDGAGRWQRMRYITLPGIKPTISILVILSIGSIINGNFDQVLTTINTMVSDVGDIIDTYVYRMGLTSAKYSYAAAVGLFKSVIALILIIGANTLARKMGNETLY